MLRKFIIVTILAFGMSQVSNLTGVELEEYNRGFDDGNKEATSDIALGFVYRYYPASGFGGPPYKFDPETGLMARWLSGCVFTSYNAGKSDGYNNQIEDWLESVGNEHNNYLDVLAYLDVNDPNMRTAWQQLNDPTYIYPWGDTLETEFGVIHSTIDTLYHNKVSNLNYFLNNDTLNIASVNPNDRIEVLYLDGFPNLIAFFSPCRGNFDCGVRVIIYDIKYGKLLLHDFINED